MKAPNTKLQDGNTKHQDPNTREAPDSKLQHGLIPATLGIWSLGLLWSLVFGVWILVFGVLLTTNPEP